VRRPASLAVLAAALIGAGLLLAGCGDEGVHTATPDTVVGSVPKPTETTPTTPALPKGDPVAGKTIFISVAGCGGCHTLKAAKSSGTVGPNLDDAKPALSLIIDRVTNGKGAMPPFKATLKPQQIADVAAFVYQSTHGG
jgi:mono/diheme cytochrome c family protein